MLNIFHIFTKYAWDKTLKGKRSKQFLMFLLKQQMNLIVNQINHGLIKEEHITKKIIQEWLNNNDI